MKIRNAFALFTLTLTLAALAGGWTYGGGIKDTPTKVADGQETHGIAPTVKNA